MTATAERFTLELPSDPAFISTARLFASSLARHFEIPEETIEDLTLAISEACSRALAAESTNGSLHLSVASHDGRLVFEIPQGDLPPGTDTPTPSHEALAAGLSLELITALFQDAAVAEDAQGRPVLRFSIP